MPLARPPGPHGAREADVNALAISPDGRWLATGSDDTTVRLWDLKADNPGQTARVLKGHDEAVRRR